MAKRKLFSFPFLAIGFVFLLSLPFLYKAPHFLFSHIFPDDYIYRFTASVGFDGKTYTGTTLSGCRLTYSMEPDWLPTGLQHNGWNTRVWSIGINVELPDRRFLIIPQTWSCNPTTFRPNPEWRVSVGLTPPYLGHQPEKYQALNPEYRPPILLYNDIENPTTQIEIWTRKGAEAQQLEISPITVGPAKWTEVEAHLSRAPGTPWVAPATAACIQLGNRECLGGPRGGFSARHFTVAEAMQVLEFSAWAATTQQSGIAVGFPSNDLGNQIRERRSLTLKPNWSTAAWELTNTSSDDVNFIVSERAWKGDFNDPVICFAPDRCRQMGKARAIVDWSSGHVLLLQFHYGSSGRIIFNGVLP